LQEKIKIKILKLSVKHITKEKSLRKNESARVSNGELSSFKIDER
jgi:hypothetical protein